LSPKAESEAPAGRGAPGGAPGEAGSGSGDRAWRTSAVALVAIWCALFAPQLFGGEIFTLGDTIAFRPFPDLSRARWQERHERTFWNPYVLAGVPATVSLADSRPQYLPGFALDLVESLRGPLARAIPMAPPLLAYLAGMLAMAGLARALWRAGPLGMVWAGAAWGLMPDLLVPLAFGHDAQCLTASLIPVALLAIHHLFAAEERKALLGASLVLALALGLTTLGGHPQIVVYAAMLAAGFAVERALTLRRPDRLAWLAGAAVVGAAMGAAAWYPALRYSAHSMRGAVEGNAALAEIAGFSLGPGDLVSMVWPWAVGHSGPAYWGGLPSTEYPRYAGIAVLAACVASWVGRRPGAGAAAFFAGATCFGLLVSLGAYLGPFYRFLHEVVPFWSRFRVPAAAQIVPQLGLALLSARLFSAPDPVLPGAPAVVPARRTWIVAGVVTALALLVALGLWLGPLAGGYAAAVVAARPAIAPATALETAHRAGLDLLVRLGVLALAIALYRWGAGRAFAAVALPLLLVADLGSVVKPTLARSTGPTSVLASAPMPELARRAAAETHVRVASTRPPNPNAPGRAGLEPQAEFNTNDWIRWRARAIGGGLSAAPGIWREAGRLLAGYQSLCALGVTYVSFVPGANFDTTFFEKVGEFPDEVVCRVRGAPGRLYAVPSVISPGNDLATVDFMLSRDFVVTEVASAAENGPIGTYPGSRKATLDWIEDEPDRVAFEVDAPNRAFVVLADTWFPGWTAQVDGGTVPIHRVNQIARGVEVPAGRHRVTMRYVPEGWAAAVPVTRVAMLVWLAGAILLGVWSRRPREARKA